MRRLLDALSDGLNGHEDLLRKELDRLRQVVPVAQPVSQAIEPPNPAAETETEPEPEPEPAAPEAPKRRKITEPPPIKLDSAAGPSPAALKAQHGKERRASL